MTRRQSLGRIFPEFVQKSTDVLIVSRLTPRFVVRTASDGKQSLVTAPASLVQILHHTWWHQSIRQTGNKECRHDDGAHFKDGQIL